MQSEELTKSKYLVVRYSTHNFNILFPYAGHAFLRPYSQTSLSLRLQLRFPACINYFIK